MTPNEILAKDMEEKGLERRSAAELWGRSWKGELIISLKSEHAELCRIHEAHLKRFPGLETEPTPEDERAGKLAKIAWEMLRDTREQMMALALHPTRPKATQSSRPGAGKRSGSHAEVIEAEPLPIAMPKPEVDVPKSVDAQ